MQLDQHTKQANTLHLQLLDLVQAAVVLIHRVVQLHP